MWRTVPTVLGDAASSAGQHGVRRRGVDGLLAFNARSRERLECMLGVWW